MFTRRGAGIALLVFSLATGGSVLAAGTPARADSVTVSTASDGSVTFHNQDGDWTIWPHCIPASSGGDLIGPGYIGKFVTSAGYTAVNGYGAGGGGQWTNPNEAGLGIFGFFESRGAPMSDWSNVWQISNRACAADSNGFGVKSATTPSFGIDANGHGYYDQDVLLGDAFVSADVITVRYHWRFDDSNVRLYSAVVQDCPSGSCGTDSRTVYVKSPMFVNNINGQFSSTAPTHISTFTSSGVYIASTTVKTNGTTGQPTTNTCAQLSDATPTNCVNATYECTWKPGPNVTPGNTTGKCMYAQRARTRFDYGNASIAAGCNTTSQLCFDVVARAYPVTGGDALPGSSTSDWEGSGQGLDQWAVNAQNDPAAGSTACSIEGTQVTNPVDQLARDWEYPVNTGSSTGNFINMEVLDKSWDNCTSGPDASSLFRRTEAAGQAYGAFFSYSINEGWTMQ